MTNKFVDNDIDLRVKISIAGNFFLYFRTIHLKYALCMCECNLDKCRVKISLAFYAQ